MLLSGETENNQNILDYCNCPNLLEGEFKNFWTHIELGAGNYGLDGHTKTSQAMTVLMALQYVSDLPNYVDNLPIKDENPYDPLHQYAVLFNTLDQLVEKQGEQGIFYVFILF